MSELNIGDILCSTWGYDQTNVDFYKIVAKHGKITYALQQIETKIVEHKKDVACYVMPCDEDSSYHGRTFKKRAKQLSDGEYGFNLGHIGTARPFSGNPVYQTPDYMGH